MPVVFSPAAERDLESIGDYIAADNPSRAITFLREIRERCKTLEESPRAAPQRDDIAPGIRMVVQGRYLIFYSLDDDCLRIERILHSARNIPGLIS